MLRACFLTNYNQYESKRHFALELSSALERSGVETEIFDAEDPIFRKNPKFHIEQFSPDFAISFNSFTPDANGKFLFDFFEVPTLCLLVDPCLYYLGMAASPHSILGVVDQFDIDALKSFGYDKAFFLPHGIPKELSDEPEEEKEFDVVFIGSCYDYIALRDQWRALSPDESSILNRASEIFLNDNATPLYAALTEAINQQGAFPKNIDFMQMFRFLDVYTRGLDRMQLIRSLKNVNVHIFGTACEGDLFPVRGWKEYTADMPNVTVHGPLEYQESLDVLKRSKISLNSSPFFKNGSHERLFAGPLLGALVAANDTLYTRKEFIDGADILLYPPKGWALLEERIQALLKNEEERRAMAAAAKKKVLEKHTWDARAKTMIKEVPSLIKKINLQ